MKPQRLFLYFSSALLLTTASIATAQDTVSTNSVARSLAADCANCHGTDGKALPGAGMEALAGVDAAQLLQKLKDFKSGAKPATIMHQIAKGYSDEQLAVLAAYFAAQKK